MKLRKVIMTAMCITMVAGVVGLTGCQNQSSGIDPSVAQSEIVLTVDKVDVSQAEFYLFLIQYLYTSNLGGTTVDADQIISEVCAEIQLEMVEYQLAQVTEGVEVQAADIAAYKENADDFYNYFGEEFLKKYGITQETVDSLYEKQAYISAITKKGTDDLKNDYSAKYDEEYGDLVFQSFYVAGFPIYQTTTDGGTMKDQEGNIMYLSEEEQKKQKELAEECYKKATENKDTTLESLVTEYSIEAYSGIDRAYIGQYPEAITEVLKSLDDGEIAPPILTDAYYLIIRMDNKNDEEYAAFTKDYIVSSNASNMLSELQNQWMSAAGINASSIDKTKFENVDVQKLADDMGKKGYSIDKGDDK